MLHFINSLVISWCINEGEWCGNQLSISETSCCNDMNCFVGDDPWNYICRTNIECSSNVGENCYVNAECCDPLVCYEGECQAIPNCRPKNSPCIDISECCSPNLCNKNICTDNPVCVNTVLESSKILNVYAPEWGLWGGRGNFDFDSFQYESISHVTYAFYLLNPPTKKRWNDFIEVYTQEFAPTSAVWSSNYKPGAARPFDIWTTTEKKFTETDGSISKGLLSHIVYLTHRAGKKVGLSVGGWSLSFNFAEIISNEVWFENFIQSSVDIVKEYNLDFYDIDWEAPACMGSRYKPYPDNGGSCINYNNASENDSILVTKLFSRLRSAFDMNGLSHILLHTAVMIREKTQEQYREASSYIDIYSLMTYDYKGGFSITGGHQSAWINEQDPKMCTKSALEYALSIGFTPSKITVGLPLYARGFYTLQPGLFNPTTGNIPSSYTSQVEVGVTAARSFDKMITATSDIKEDYEHMGSWVQNPTTLETWTFVTPNMSAYMTKKIMCENDLAGTILWDQTDPGNSPHQTQHINEIAKAYNDCEKPDGLLFEILPTFPYGNVDISVNPSGKVYLENGETINIQLDCLKSNCQIGFIALDSNIIASVSGLTQWDYMLTMTKEHKLWVSFIPV